MSKTDLAKIEKQFLEDAVTNLKNWSEDKFIGGGVETARDYALVHEDLRHAGMLNDLDKSFAKAKLTKIVKSITFESAFGVHNAANTTLDKAIDSLQGLMK